MQIFNTIKLNKNSTQHLYIQLYNQIKTLITNGDITHHTKLPPIRKLSNLLAVNNVTIVNAYKLLEQEGYVYKKIGSGTFVEDLNTKNLQSKLINEDIQSFSEEMNESEITKDYLNTRSINFASTAPTPDLFPVDDFKIVLNEVLDRDKGKAFIYQESEGYYPLRESIKAYIQNYGINTDIENIQIISGAQQGIDILSKSLVEYGDIVFTESPTYPGAISAFKSRAARIIDIPIEKEGIDIKTLQNKLKSFRPKFIYLMPNFQNPTGYSYSKERKQRLLELAEEYNTFIIEDDYLSDLSFSGNVNSTLKSIDSSNRVIYIKSFSKIFMPGLRLAFMIIPKSIYNEVLSAKHTSDISTSGLIQRAFDLYLNKGKWQKHIQHMEDIYKKRFDILVESINKYMPNEISWYIPNGGLNFWLSLPEGYSANELYKLSRKKQVVFVPGSVFFADQRDSTHFRVSIASVYSKEIPKGIKKLSMLIEVFLKEYKNKQTAMDMYTPYL